MRSRGSGRSASPQEVALVLVLVVQQPPRPRARARAREVRDVVFPSVRYSFTSHLTLLVTSEAPAQSADQKLEHKKYVTTLLHFLGDGVIADLFAECRVSKRH